MASENKLNYIIPQFVKYQNIDDLLENNSHHSLFNENNLSINDVLKENFVCIVGEPGIGKSRLLDEVKERILPKPFFCKASKFTVLSTPKENEYCIIDALDEVEGYSFYDVLQSIKHYKKENPKVKVLFTCRKHYVASYAQHFADCNHLTFIEICRLNERNVMNVISSDNCNCSKVTLENINKSPKLKELITIPRYLTFLLEYIKQKRECLNIGELFEYMIASSIKAAIEAHKGIQNTESIRILLQRVLEKVAFVMEISRKDQISKDELYTILDGIKGNMTQMFIANFDLLYFESRILKDTDGTLQFENTELQEYLAAKELCRQDNMESVLYDVAVHKELKHIYPNWYDVIPHISYSKDRIHTFINVFKLIISYESNLENESFRNLLKYIDPSVLSIQQKEELFSIIFEHYQRVPAYIMWKSSMSNLLQECYTTNCDTQIRLPLSKLNKIQLSNVTVTLDAIVEANKHSDGIYNYWRQTANYLMGTDDNENKLAALNLYNALKCIDELIQLSESYSYFTKKLKEKYSEVTGYMKIANNSVVNCWLNDCYTSNSYAINAILNIEDLYTLIYAYNRIIEDRKIYEFFNEKGSLAVFYEFHLKQQFDIAWKGNTESKELITRIMASFISNHSYTTHSMINPIAKQILLDETAGQLFVMSFKRIWDLEDLFRRFDAEFIDIELISSLDKLLSEAKIESWRIDGILTNLINKIRNDKDKKDSIAEYVERYAETFERWDKESSKRENKEVNYHDQQLVKIYNSLSDPKVSKSNKYETAFKLSQNIDFLKTQDPIPLVDVIKTFFEELDLNQMILKRNARLSRSLPKISAFVKVLYSLSFLDLLKEYRIILIKILPNICITRYYDANEIKEIKKIYRSVIGNINNDEKAQVVKWWKERKDDFMDISPDDICTCIVDYGIDALYYKLEEYIEQYIRHQDFNHSIAAAKALDIISNGDYGWDIDRYEKLFSLLENDSVTSIKMQCNAIMIEKFQYSEAITWRINYLKKNVIIFSRNKTEESHPISCEEAEIISTNPYMFRCFIRIKENEALAKQMLNLFDSGLKLCVKPETQQYAYYLLSQIYHFFVNLNKTDYILMLREKVEELNKKNVSYLATNIMNNAEMLFLKNEKTNIGKAVKRYNKCIEESHLSIRNDGDLRRYFTQIYCDVQKEIQDQGIYALVRQDSLNEDFIQRELKNTIINKCCQMGLETTIRVDREVTLQDNKRTDILIRYGLCNPIMLELKLLHNNEIQQDSKRHKYKEKFIQYINATNPCLSVFWVFDVHKGGDSSKFDELKEEYKDLLNTSVFLTDCKCSSGIETGIRENKS